VGVPKISLNQALFISLGNGTTPLPIALVGCSNHQKDQQVFKSLTRYVESRPTWYSYLDFGL